MKSVDLYLASRLAARGLTSYAPLSEEDVPPPTGPPAELDTLVAVGALTADEAEAWRLRFTAAQKTFEPPPGARERAAAYLEAVKRSGDENRIRAVEWAYLALGLIEAELLDDVPDLRDDDAFGPEPTFERVIAGPFSRAGGLQVTFAVIYDTRVDLHWDFEHGLPSEAAARAELELYYDDDLTSSDFGIFELGDDVATAYVYRGGSYDYRSGTHTFEPAPPAAATELVLTVAGDRAVIPIPA